ncbi:uncharacterized protein LOC131431865 isoform X2 [Malaya genurostris]|uniref:uncharacterized protein LOC131431865 isoform X2 n=1 Tax=Malaya genurostris TaxID=325434 RepID=UPI0026F3E4B9|nr:uncharacterized protein LOC131431865 isoform X2 [Malaya genurostris]
MPIRNYFLSNLQNAIRKSKRKKMEVKTLHTMAIVIIAIVYCLSVTTAQSNYASQANNIEYHGEGLPDEATLDGKVTKLDDISPIIFLNQTKAVLNCAAGSMQVELKFNERFYGTAYANFDRNSACQISGKGDMGYILELPLKGCGTKQEPQRVFTNNIIIRFHPGLEMDGDEIITIVCRYPPPVAPIPAGFPAPIITDIVPALILEPPLKGIQILFIICAIMFLTLLLIGLGISYYCLRRQPIPIVRRIIHVGSGSEITALETGSIGCLSALKLPHAHVALHRTQSISGSDGPLIPSDYPSESHSENEELDTGSLPVSSHGSFENGVFIQDNSSIYSENGGYAQEIRSGSICETSPKFQIHVRVKRALPPMQSSLSSDSDSSTSINRTERNNLSTIPESYEDARSDSVLTLGSLPEAGQSQFIHSPDLHLIQAVMKSPSNLSKTSTFSQIQRDTWPDINANGCHDSSTRSIVSLGTEITDTHSMTEIIDSSHLYPRFSHDVLNMLNSKNVLESKVNKMKKNEISSHIVDDVYTQTVTEKTTVEDIERHKRVVTNYKAMPVVDTNWNVTIRNYQEYSDPVWEDFSDISSASGVATTRHIPTQIIIPNSTHLSKNDQFLQSPELVCNIKPIELPPEDKSVSNWDILIRVLQDVEIPDIAITKVELQSTNAVGQLSYNDKAKWKEIITTESTLRTMLTEAVIREDFERIRADARYEKLFEPQSWEIIMRILTPPDDAELRKSRRKRRETWDTRSRRSSLPTLYEYDSDGRSSVRTISQEPIVIIRQNRDISNSAKPLSRKSSHSSYSTNNAEYRSLTEVLIDYVKPRYSDSLSEGSSLSTNRNYEDDNYDRRSIQHSSSHPSLARSASEFTEQWIAPDETASSLSENEAIFEHIPRVARENRTQYIETSFKSRSYEW